mgnify:CR=1 FL=1
MEWDGEKSVSVKRIFVNKEKIPNVKIGNIIKVRGKLRQFEEAANKGNFDSRKYYLSLGFYGKIEAGTIEIIKQWLQRNKDRDFMNWEWNNWKDWKSFAVIIMGYFLL